MINFSEFEKVKICKGSRWSSAYYAVTTEGLQPNNRGGYNDCIPMTAADLIKNINNGEYAKECKDNWQRHVDLHPDDKQPLKNFASSIYPFEDHRYTIYEKIYDEQLNKIKQVTTLYAYKKWTGFIGYDFDAPKEYFNHDERRLLGKTLKEILARNLMRKPWFIGSLVSTGGHGTHCLTAVKVPDWYYHLDVNDMVKYHHCVWWYLLKEMLKSLFELSEELYFLEEDQIYKLVDDCTLTVNQTVNISPIEDNMLVNIDFKHIEINDITQDNFKTYFDDIENDVINSLNYVDELFLKLHGTSDDISKSDKFKKGNDANFKIIPCDDFDINILDKCKGPWHFEHKREHNDFWTGNQIIHTLLHFFSVDTVKAIWYHPKFYDCDPKDWIRFIDSWEFDNTVPPNFKLMNWLNANCGMNLHYQFDDNTENTTIINLKDNEYLYDKKTELLDSIKDGYNLWDAAPCTGKTTFWKMIFENNKFDPINNIDPKNYILTEPYNSICKSKFTEQQSDGIVNIIVGSKRIKWTNVNNIITNYNHIVLMTQEQIDQTDILIVDESHLIFSEYYRYDILLKFLLWASGFKKVLFMSGTPTIENKYFNNCNIVKINKHQDKKITHEFLQWYPMEYTSDSEIKIWNHFEPWNLSVFVNFLVKSGKKVYIYDSNISYQKCLKFKEMNNDIKIAIYHKKELDDEGLGDIEYIDKYHRLGDEYDVLISSCYFGVGNDLLDGDEGKYKKAAVILCGIHTPHEIYQVCSRWRNIQEVNIYTIIDNQFYAKDEYDYDKVFEHEKKKLIYEREDALNRDKSITLFGKKIRNISDDGIDFCALLKANDICGKTIGFINAKLITYGIDIDDRIMPLVYDLQNYSQHLDYANALKLTRSEIRRDFIEAIVDNYNNLSYDVLPWNHTDAKIENWERICYRLAKIYDIDTFKAELHHICAISNVDGYKLFIDLYNAKNNKDYNELYWLYQCFTHLVKKDNMINEWISHNDSIIMKTFVLYTSHVNKGESYKLINRYNINDYYNRWKKAVYDFCICYDIEVNRDILFAEDIDEYTIDGVKVTFGDLDISKYNQNIERTKYANLSYEENLLNELVIYHCNKQIIMNSVNRKKVVTVTDKFKHPEKYKLEIGQEFESCTAISEYTKKSKKTVSQWITKKWLSY